MIHWSVELSREEMTIKCNFVTGKGCNRCRPYLKPTVHLYLANTSSTLLSSGVPQEVKIILSFSWLARPRDEGTRAVTRIGHGSLSEWVGRDVTCWMMNYCSCCRLGVMVKDGVSMEGCEGSFQSYAIWLNIVVLIKGTSCE